MRYDEIDLQGQLKIKGSTGGDKQIISYQSNDLVWATASSPPSNDIIKKTSNRTILVQSVIDDTILSGDNLIAAVNDANSLAPSLSLNKYNRLTVLIMPGVYDVSNSANGLEITQSFIDLIGFSSNPRSVNLTSDLGPQQTIYYNGCLDSKLENITLKSPVSSSSPTVNFRTSTDCYLKWKNLILMGNGFRNFNNTELYSVTNLIGEFDDITVNEGNFAVAQESINAQFNNIRILNSGDNFVSNSDFNIQGTFSNIEIIASDKSFYHEFNSIGEIKGTFENIRVTNTTGNVFKSGNMNMSCSNLYFGSSNVGDIFVSGNELLGSYEDIRVISSGYNSFISATSINASFKNIEITGTPPKSIFFNNGASNSSIHGTFSDIFVSTTGAIRNFIVPCTHSGFINIDINNLTIQNEISGYFVAVPQSATVSGNFKDIDLANVGRVFGNQANGSLLANFENIEIQSIGDQSFTSQADIVCKVLNLKIYDFTSNPWIFLGNGYFDLDMTNFTLISNPSRAVAFAYGQDVNLKMRNVFFEGKVSYFLAVPNLPAQIDCDNLVISRLGQQVGNNQFEFGTLIGTFSNIKIFESNLEAYPFITTGSNMVINVENFYMKAFSNSTFYSGGDLIGKFKDVRIGNFTTASYPSFSANGNSYLVVDDLRIGNGDLDTLNTNDNIFESVTGTLYGTFSKVQIGSSWSACFVAENGKIEGSYKDILIYSTDTGWSFVSPNYENTPIMDNVIMKTNIGLTFGGRMFNCEIFDPKVNKGIQDNVSMRLAYSSGEVIVENSDFYLRDEYLELNDPANQSSVVSVNGNLSDVHFFYNTLLHKLPNSGSGFDILPIQGGFNATPSNIKII